MDKLTEYLEQYALISLEKQDRLALLLGDHTPALDLDSGKIRLDNVEFPFQVLGTESDNTLIWLWAWADEQTEDVPEPLLRASRELREWGLRQHLQEFTRPSIDLGRADGHVFSMIAGEVCRAGCYYRDAYDGGAAFLLLFGALIDAQPSFDLSRLSQRLLELISRYELNHRNALRSYFRTRGLFVQETGPSMSCELDSGERLSAEFTDAGHLIRLNEEAVTA
jgi:hypothetical protein